MTIILNYTEPVIGRCKKIDTINDVTTVSYTSPVSAMKFQYKDGQKTAGYFNLLRLGAPLPETVYARTSWLHTYWNGAYKNQSVGSTQNVIFEGCLNDLGLGFPSIDFGELTPSQIDAMWETASSKMLKNIKDEKVNLAMAVAERAQTADLLAKSALRIYNAITSLKRGNLREAAEAVGAPHPSKRRQGAFAKRVAKAQKDRNHTLMTDNLSQGILEIQYGWRPLLGDIYGSAQLIAAKPTDEVYITRRSTVTRSNGTSFPVYILYGQGTMIQNTQRTARYKIRFSLANQLTRTMAQTGFSNPALLAWELLPWSFVIDWFIPIGDYLSSLDATSGLSFHSGMISMRSRHEVKCDITWNGGTGSNQFSGSAHASKVQNAYNRVPLLDFPSPQLPRFKNPLSTEHALNAVALLSTHRKSVFS